MNKNHSFFFKVDALVLFLIDGGKNEPHPSKFDIGWLYYTYRSSYFQSSRKNILTINVNNSHKISSL